MKPKRTTPLRDAVGRRSRVRRRARASGAVPGRAMARPRPRRPRRPASARMSTEARLTLKQTRTSRVESASSSRESASRSLSALLRRKTRGGQTRRLARTSRRAERPRRVPARSTRASAVLEVADKHALGSPRPRHHLSPAPPRRSSVADFGDAPPRRAFGEAATIRVQVRTTFENVAASRDARSR